MLLILKLLTITVVGIVSLCINCSFGGTSYLILLLYFILMIALIALTIVQIIKCTGAYEKLLLYFSNFCCKVIIILTFSPIVGTVEQNASLALPLLWSTGVVSW